MTFGLCRICDPVGWSRGLSGASDAQKPALRDRWHFPDRDIDIPQDKLNRDTIQRNRVKSWRFLPVISRTCSQGIDSTRVGLVLYVEDMTNGLSPASNWIDIHVLETCRKAWNKSLIFLIMKIRLYLLEYELSGWNWYVVKWYSKDIKPSNAFIYT